MKKDFVFASLLLVGGACTEIQKETDRTPSTNSTSFSVSDDSSNENKYVVQKKMPTVARNEVGSKNKYSLKGETNFREICKNIINDLYVSQLKDPSRVIVFIQRVKERSRSTKSFHVDLYVKDEIEVKEKILHVIVSFYGDDFYLLAARGALLESGGILHLIRNDTKKRMFEVAEKIASAMQWTVNQDIYDDSTEIRVKFTSKTDHEFACFSSQTGLLVRFGSLPPPD